MKTLKNITTRDNTLTAVQSKTKNQAPHGSILQAYKDKATQLQPTKEEELLQGKFETVQKIEVDEEEPVQGKFKTTQLATEEEEPLQRQPNNTGLPDNLKSGIENMSGYSMDDVKVHYNSSQPATLQAHAYAQGTDIHVAPGQEKHVPHEAWHVVQQKQGRVKPTTQMKGTVPVNDEAGLEKEADVMGAKALQMSQENIQSKPAEMKNTGMNSYVEGRNTLQRKITIGIGQDTETWDKEMDYINPKWNFDTATKKLYLQWLKDETVDHAYPNREELFNALHMASPSRTEYHFGLNGPIPGAHALGPRMDYINKTHAGTVAEYDWIDIPGRLGIPLPGHINAADHDRLPGAIGTGNSTDYDTVRADAITHKGSIEAGTGAPGLPVFANKSAKYTWYRKAKSTPKTSVNIRPDSDGFNAGTDYSKSALIDMLVQGKNIHMHLTGMLARWKPGRPVMTGADFLTVLNKGGGSGVGKNDVTMRELRFIWRYWNTRKLTMADDTDTEKQYSFEGHTIFYYKDKVVPAPWTWEATETGADF